MEVGEQILKFFRLWAVVDGVQPFLPIAASTNISAVLDFITIPRHLRIVREWESKGIRVYASYYSLLNGEYANDIPRVDNSDGELYKKLVKSLENPNLKLAEFLELQELIPNSVVMRDWKGYHENSPRFMNSYTASNYMEVFRYSVNLGLLLNLVDNMLPGSRIENLLRFETIVGKFVYALPMRIEKNPEFAPALRSPDPYRRAKIQEPPLGREVGPTLSEAQFEHLPNDIIYYTALFMDADELLRICELSRRMAQLFCSESVRAISFWINKYRYDLREDIPDNIERTVAGVRKWYFDRLLTNLAITTWDNIIVTGRFYFDVLLALSTTGTDRPSSFGEAEFNKILSKWGIRIWRDLVEASQGSGSEDDNSSDADGYFLREHGIIEVPRWKTLGEITDGLLAITLKKTLIDLLNTEFSPFGERLIRDDDNSMSLTYIYEHYYSSLVKKILRAATENGEIELSRFLTIVRHILKNQPK
jgi:hypothetical protein